MAAAAFESGRMLPGYVSAKPVEKEAGRRGRRIGKWKEEAYD